MTALASSREDKWDTMIHMDCYDRRILAFVLNRPSDEQLPERECRNWFGISSRAVLRRFDAVVDVYLSHHVPLDDADRELLRRAAHYRLVHRQSDSGPSPQ
jgi:hypothetical protein